MDPWHDSIAVNPDWRERQESSSSEPRATPDSNDKMASNRNSAHTIPKVAQPRTPLSFDLPDIIYPHQDPSSASHSPSQNSNSIPSDDRNLQLANQPTASARKRVHSGDLSPVTRYSKGSTLNPHRRSQRLSSTRPTSFPASSHSRKKNSDEERIASEHRLSLHNIGMGIFGDPRESDSQYEAQITDLQRFTPAVKTLVPSPVNTLPSPLKRPLSHRAALHSGQGTLQASTMPIDIPQSLSPDPPLQDRAENSSPEKTTPRKGGKKVLNHFLADLKGKPKSKTRPETEEDRWIYSHIDEYIHDLRQSLQVSPAITQRVHIAQAELEYRYFTLFNALDSERPIPSPLDAIRWKRRNLDKKRKQKPELNKLYPDGIEHGLHSTPSSRFSAMIGSSTNPDQPHFIVPRRLVVEQPGLPSTSAKDTLDYNEEDASLASRKKESKEWNLSAQLMKDYLNATQISRARLHRNEQTSSGLFPPKIASNLTKGKHGEDSQNSDSSNNGKGLFSTVERVKKVVSRNALPHGKLQGKLGEKDTGNLFNSNGFVPPAQELHSDPSILLRNGELPHSEEELLPRNPGYEDDGRENILDGGLITTEARKGDMSPDGLGSFLNQEAGGNVNEANSRFGSSLDANDFVGKHSRWSEIVNMGDTNVFMKHKEQEEMVELYTERSSLLRASRSQEKHGLHVIQTAITAINDYFGMLSSAAESLAAAHDPMSREVLVPLNSSISLSCNSFITCDTQAMNPSSGGGLLSQDQLVACRQEAQRTGRTNLLDPLLQEYQKVLPNLSSHTTGYYPSSPAARELIKEVGAGWNSLASGVNKLRSLHQESNKQLDIVKEHQKIISLRVERVPPELGRNEELSRQLFPENSSGQLLPDWVPQWAQDILRWLSPHVQRLADTILNTLRVIFVVISWISSYLPDSFKSIISWLTTNIFVLIWMFCRIVYAIILWIFQLPPIRIFLRLIAIAINLLQPLQQFTWSILFLIGSFVVWRYLFLSSPHNSVALNC
ncbi:hypothetical protein FRC02_008120 [Tulasnella sp. 418]|nr:hypothetical protein FRC02_008120 [Tulasnella sp. 418]